MVVVKIFISYKDRHKILKSDILTPIQTGRAIADEIFDDMIGDDTGDNISAENDIYAELTAQYWVWKNYDKIGNPDYVGFMHYRRHFIFNENYVNKKQDKKSKYGYSGYIFNDFDESYLSAINLQDNYIKKAVDECDIIFVKKANTKYLGCKNGLEDFIKNCYGSHKEDYDRCMQIVKKIYPEYSSEIQQLQKGPYRYYYNMFIMKKELFFEYSEFLFSILTELKKEINTEFYSEKAKRVLGYMGEFLLSLFAFKKTKDKNLRIKELYSSFILNTSTDIVDSFNFIEPAFKDQNIVIAVSSSDEYSPYLCVYLQSLKEHADQNKNYDIVIFERNIEQRTKDIIVNHIATNNISIRYYNPMQFFKNCKLFISHEYFKEECYFRLASPLIFRNYDKVIFTDLDLILCDDILKLGDFNLDSNPIACCSEQLWPELYMCNCSIYNINIKNYTDNILKLKTPYDYFNTGVCIFNVKKCNEENSFENLLNEIKNNHFLYQEQCAINKYFKGRIYKLPENWNYELEHNLMQNKNNIKIYKIYKEKEKDAKILHFLGRFKPWINPKEYKAEVWWSYARKTPFYEEILRRMCSCSSVPVEIFKDVLQYKKNLFGYWKYKLLRNFVFGLQRQKYIDKKHILKHKISVAKNIMR